MKKITTLFKKNPNDLSLVINEVNPENQWVLDGEGYPTRKWDGTACAVINGELYKRYDVKRGKNVPVGAIPCRSDPANKYHFEAFDSTYIDNDSTFELVGPKVQGNPEGFKEHRLIQHSSCVLPTVGDYSFDGLKLWLSNNDVEGIVFHHSTDGRMCKIRKSDFGIKRKEKELV